MIKLKNWKNASAFLLVLFVFSGLNAQMVDLSFDQQLNCNQNQYCTTLQIKAGDTTDFEIGNSSVYFTYDYNVLAFASYTQIGFVGPFVCSGSNGTWDNHAYDGISVPGEFLLTLVKYGFNGSCPVINDSGWLPIGEVCFDIIDANGSPNLEFGNDLTTFNYSMNNGADHVPLGTMNTMDPPNALDCSNCPSAGLTCNDNDPNTFDDVEDGNCNCFGTKLGKFMAHVILEGFWDTTSNKMGNGMINEGIVPKDQPYNIAPFNYTGTESVTDFPVDAIDWILLELRDTTDLSTILAAKAFLLGGDGRIMDVDGGYDLDFDNIPIGSYQLAIRHRSHLDILSAGPLVFWENPITYDFTSNASMVWGVEQLKFHDNRFVMYSGDYDGNQIMNNLDFNAWKLNNAAVYNYLVIDGDGSGIINSLDFNLWQRNRAKIGGLFDF